MHSAHSPPPPLFCSPATLTRLRGCHSFCITAICFLNYFFWKGKSKFFHSLQNKNIRQPPCLSSRHSPSFFVLLCRRLVRTRVGSRLSVCKALQPLFHWLAQGCFTCCCFFSTAGWIQKGIQKEYREIQIHQASVCSLFSFIHSSLRFIPFRVAPFHSTSFLSASLHSFHTLQQHSKRNSFLHSTHTLLYFIPSCNLLFNTHSKPFSKFTGLHSIPCCSLHSSNPFTCS